MEQRSMNLTNFLEGIHKETDALCEEFAQFSDGMRMLILLQRKKDGGHNKEEIRMLETVFTFDEESFKRGVLKMLLLRLLHPTARLYLSVNPRSMHKIIRKIEIELLECHYCDEVKRDYTYKKLIKAPRHFVMQQANKAGNLFILDVDDVEGRDMYGEALQWLAETNIDIIKTYRTRNGWHIITEPFNPGLFKFGEVKVDGLLLLKY